MGGSFNARPLVHFAKYIPRLFKIWLTEDSNSLCSDFFKIEHSYIYGLSFPSKQATLFSFHRVGISWHFWHVSKVLKTLSVYQAMILKKAAIDAHILSTFHSQEEAVKVSVSAEYIYFG